MSSIPFRLAFGRDDFVVNVWDTAGQERFRCLVPLYARESDIVVLTFSVASSESFQGHKSWFDQIRTEMKLTCPVILVGNKSDEQWQVEKGHALQWGLERGCPTIFTSAKSAENVKELFVLIAETIVKGRSERRARIESPVPSTARDDDCC
jgi:small GTP-binding protein